MSGIAVYHFSNGDVKKFEELTRKGITYVNDNFDKIEKANSKKVTLYANLSACYQEDDEKMKATLKKAESFVDDETNGRQLMMLYFNLCFYYLEENDLDNFFKSKKDLDDRLENLELTQVVKIRYALIEALALKAKKKFEECKKVLFKIFEDKGDKNYGIHLNYVLETLLEVTIDHGSKAELHELFKLQRNEMHLQYKNERVKEIAKKEAQYHLQMTELKAQYNLELLQNEQLLRKEIEQEKKKTDNINKQLEKFTGMVAHDLKAPLNTALGYINLLNHFGDQKDASEIELFSHLENAVSGMKVTINELLQYAKIGEGEIKYEKVDLNEVIGNVLSDLNFEIESSKAKVKVQKLPVVNGVRSYIKILFQNLISNSIKFKDLERGIEIDIFAERFDDRFRLNLKDNGIGIDEPEIDKIFLPYTRSDNAISYDGHGLGLSTCRKIMSVHKGDIRALNNKDFGVTFELEFPLKS